jgi:hypothetical protein
MRAEGARTGQKAKLTLGIPPAHCVHRPPSRREGGYWRIRAQSLRRNRTSSIACASSPSRLRKYSAPFASEGGGERSERGMRAEGARTGQKAKLTLGIPAAHCVHRPPSRREGGYWRIRAQTLRRNRTSSIACASSPSRLRRYSAPFACEGGSERSERGMRAERRDNRAEGLADARHPPGSLRSPTPFTT